jgi:hypothetical protein
MPAESIACLTCRERVAYRRGCCKRCYQRHGAQVRAGLTTWAALVAAGRALAARPAGEGWRGWSSNTGAQ